MGAAMYLELKENRPHGTKAYPYDQSYIHKISHTFQFPVHWHHEFEIIYIAQGSLDISISEQLYQGTSGDIYFVNSKELHFMGSADRNVAYYTMLFPLEFISLQTDDALETELMRPLRNGILQFPHHLPNNADKENLSAILNKIISLNPCSDFPSQIRTRAFLLEFIAELKQTQNFFMENYGVSNTFQRELLAFIHGHFMESLSLTTLAGRFHLSEKYLSRYFKEHFHISFIQYLNHLRLTHAKKLLETSELSITEIALCSGFSSDSYFIRIFKKTYGISPLKYRRLP
jgi:Transcriptional regulator containing an amidase domain and an AraC-type DNA-binding HTH domain